MGKYKRPIQDAVRLAIWPSILGACGLVILFQLFLLIEVLFARFDSWEELLRLGLMFLILWPLAYVYCFFYYR